MKPLQVAMTVLTILTIVCGVSTCSSVSHEENCDKFWSAARKAKNSDEAEALFVKALNEAERSENIWQKPRLLLEIGQFELKHERLAEAEKHVREAEQIFKNFADKADMKSDQRSFTVDYMSALVTLGKTLTASKKYDEAEQTFKTALELHERTNGDVTRKVEIYRNYAETLRRMGREKEALDLEIKADSVFTSLGDCDKLFQKTQEFLDQNKIDEAYKSSQTALLASEKFGATSSRCRDAFFHAGVVALSQGENDQAEKMLLKSLDPKDYPANRPGFVEGNTKLLLGVCYDLKGNVAEANKFYDRAMTEYPLSIGMLMQTANRLFAKGHADQALKLLDRGIALNNKYVRNHFRHSDFLTRKGEMLIGLKRIAEAEQCFREDLKVQAAGAKLERARFHNAIFRLSGSLNAQNKLDDDLKFLTTIQIPKGFSKSDAEIIRAFTLCRISYNYRLRNQPEKAEKLAQEALELAKRHNVESATDTALSLLADSYRDTKQYDKAEELYLRDYEILKKGKNHEAKLNAMFRLAELYQVEGKLDLSEKWWEQQWTIMKEHPHPEPARPYLVALRLAQTYHSKENFDKCIEWLDIAQHEYETHDQYNPTYVDTALVLRADIFKFNKNFPKAFEFYKKELAYIEEHLRELPAEGMPNSITRMLVMAEHFLQTGETQKAEEAILLSINACKKHKPVNLSALNKRIERWINLARSKGLTDVADRCSKILNGK